MDSNVKSVTQAANFNDPTRKPLDSNSKAETANMRASQPARKPFYLRQFAIVGACLTIVAAGAWTAFQYYM